MSEKSTLNLPRLRAAMSESCLLLSGEKGMTKPTLERHLRELLDCINMIDNAARTQ